MKRSLPGKVDCLEQCLDHDGSMIQVTDWQMLHKCGGRSVSSQVGGQRPTLPANFIMNTPPVQSQLPNPSPHNDEQSAEAKPDV